jgi:hypothetical protein
LPSLFEARRRLSTSATALRRAGNQTRALQSSQGRRPRPPSFSDVSRLLPCGSGDTQRAAHRPFAPAPVKVSLTYVSLPNRDTESNASPSKLSLRSIVRIYEHGSKDRAKDASPGARDDLSCLRRVHTLYRVCRRRSPPRRPPDIRCHRRACLSRGVPCVQTDRPRSSFPKTPREERLLPENRDAFHRHVTRRNLVRGGIAPSGLRAGSLSHAAHTSSPERRRCFEWALQGHGTVTRGSVNDSRVQAPFWTRWDCHAWD